MGVRIGILDSGVMTNHEALSEYNIKGFSICVANNTIIVNDNFGDDIGHGTAITYLMYNALKDLYDEIEIINIKIFSKDCKIDYNDLLLILNYIDKNEKFDFLNISSGIIQCGDVSELQNICNSFYYKNCFIVAAYDNDGAISFPAALNNVIGVDSNSEIKNLEYKHNGIVDVFSQSRFIRVPSINGGMTLVKGNSYSCALITAELARKKINGFHIYVNLNSHKTNYLAGNNPEVSIMRKSVVFPFNKEIHAIACHEDLLTTQIVAYYSHRATGQVGRKICDILPWSSNQNIIHDIDKIDWGKFDSLILGHSDELERLTNRNFKEDLLKEAQKHKKFVFSFDPLYQYPQYKDIYYYPCIENSDVPFNYGKLYKTDKPILSIIGTGSKQGKFTLQLILKKLFKEMGYKIGQLGTEPSALLFGMDSVFPCGYNSAVRLSLYNTIAKINQIIYYLSQKDNDIILTGSQNAIITYNDHNIENFPIYHQVVLQAINPDAMVLCINPFDTVDYIKQTISAAESLTEGKVIAIVCFPYDIDENWVVWQNKRIKMSVDKIESKRKEIESALNQKMYMLDNLKDRYELMNRIISFFQS